MTATINPEILRLRNLVLFFYYSLFAVLFLHSLGMTIGLSPTTFVIWLFQVAPLGLVAAGLHRVRLRLYQWLSLSVVEFRRSDVFCAWGIDCLHPR